MWLQPREFSLMEAYMDLVLQARWGTEPQDVLTRDGRVMRVERGECWRSYEGWAQRWGMAKSKARRTIGRLAKTGFVSTRVEHGLLCLAVRDYAVFFAGAAWQNHSAPGSDTGTTSAKAGPAADGAFPTGERV